MYVVNSHGKSNWIINPVQGQGTRDEHPRDDAGVFAQLGDRYAVPLFRKPSESYFF